MSNPDRSFNYSLDYPKLNLRRKKTLYRVGKGEQGVLLVEPYKSEILPHWRFRTPAIARKSSREIFALFQNYCAKHDFVGADMARKFLQMGYTRARRYTNHAGGRKYGPGRKLLPFQNDPVKAESASIFKRLWENAEKQEWYREAKQKWKARLG